MEPAWTWPYADPLPSPPQHVATPVLASDVTLSSSASTQGDSSCSSSASTFRLSSSDTSLAELTGDPGTKSRRNSATDRNRAVFRAVRTRIAENSVPIREELNPLLAEDDVERGVRERKGRRVATQPLDARGGAGHVQRGRHRIEPNHSTTGPYPVRRATSDDACPACDVQDAVAGVRVDRVEQVARPGVERDLSASGAFGRHAVTAPWSRAP